MPDYSEQEAREAKRIVDRLLDPEPGSREIESTVVVSDIESDAADFAEDLELLEYMDSDVPALRVGEEDMVPVALSLVLGLPSYPFAVLRRGVPTGYWRRTLNFRDFVRLYSRVLHENQGFPGIATISREQAQSTFERRAVEFLATRMAGVHDLERQNSRRWSSVSFLSVAKRAGGTRVSTPGCHFTVTTNSSGLRVFWSGAYRVSPKYFSHPTSPTLGVLQSGTYVFGVDGGAYGSDIQWDLKAEVTLPGNPHAHLNY